MSLTRNQRRAVKALRHLIDQLEEGKSSKVVQAELIRDTAGLLGDLAYDMKPSLRLRIAVTLDRISDELTDKPYREKR
jgi:hypothetical protein